MDLNFYTPESRPDFIPEGILESDFHFIEKISLNSKKGECVTYFSPITDELCNIVNKISKNIDSKSHLLLQRILGKTHQNKHEELCSYVVKGGRLTCCHLSKTAGKNNRHCRFTYLLDAIS